MYLTQMLATIGFFTVILVLGSLLGLFASSIWLGLGIFALVWFLGRAVIEMKNRD